jgi:crossover junction endodeoxyribonuclease RusA
MIEIMLPFPPSANHLYRRVGNRTLLSREGRRFRDNVAVLVACAGHPRFDSPVRADVELFPPDNRKRDVDNLTKSLFDALEKAGMLSNDNIIKKYSVSMNEQVPNGMCIVRIQKL